MQNIEISDAPLDYVVLDRMLSRAKGHLLMRRQSGFIGSLVCNHQYIWDMSNSTGWCDGETIGINPYFFRALTTGERVFFLGHENWHTGYDHMGRMGKRDPEIWNQAADFRINGDMDNEGYDLGRIREWCCLDHKYDGLRTEQIYDIIIDNMPPPPPPCPDDTEGEGIPDEGGNQPKDDNSGGDAGENTAPTPQQARESFGRDIRPNPSGNPHAVQSKIVAAVQAARMVKEAGDLPGEIDQIVDEFLYPPLNWEHHVSRWFTERDASDYSWRYPSRRSEDEYLPTRMSDNGLDHLLYGFDVSGSVSDDEINYSFSQVRHIHKHLAPEKITIFTFDTIIQNVFELNREDYFEGFNITGRGGTCLKCVSKLLEERRPSGAVIFSDLYCQPMEKDLRIPILWLVYNHPNAKIPFGTSVHIKPEDISL